MLMPIINKFIAAIEDGEVDKIEMLNLPPEEIDGFEDLDSGSAIEFEEINA